ncbi:MAG: hypothetical protein HRT66_08465 [Flavobacteriaceae bacterium]|nr:hypothetical protein [Flavobacteriaceae bacterium]
MNSEISSIIVLSVLLISCTNDTEEVTQIPEFIDIVDARTSIEGNMITSTITIKELPVSLDFYSNELSVNSLEYKWSVYFDINNDNIDDYSFSISNYKFSSQEQTYGYTLDNTQHSIWAITDGVGSHIGEVNASITGNTITLEVNTNHYDLLKTITDQSSISYRTYYNNGTNRYEDRF